MSSSSPPSPEPSLSGMPPTPPSLTGVFTSFFPRTPSPSLSEVDLAFDQGKAAPAEQKLFSYRDYLTSGYRQINVDAISETRNIFIAVGIAALIHALQENNDDYFQAMVINLFGEESRVHCENIRCILENHYFGGYLPSQDILANLLTQVWRKRVLQRFRADLSVEEVKHHAGPAAKEDIPTDDQLFPVMQQLLGIRITVFSSQLHRTDHVDASVRGEIVLIEHRPAHYHYLTTRRLPRVVEVKLAEIKQEQSTVVVLPNPRPQMPLRLNDFLEDTKLHMLSFLAPRDMMSAGRISKAWPLLAKIAFAQRKLNIPKNMPDEVMQSIGRLIQNIDQYYNRLLEKLYYKDSFKFITLLGFATTCMDVLSEKAEEAEEAQKQVDASKQDQKEKSKAEPVRTATLDDTQYQVINWIIDDNVAALKSFVAAHPTFNFNYVDNFFISPLLWAIWLNNAEIIRILQQANSQLLPVVSPLSRQEYFLSSIKLAKVKPLFAEIIAEHCHGLAELEYKDNNGNMLPIVWAPVTEGLYDLPLAKTVSNLIRHGAKIHEMKHPLHPDQPLLFDFLSRGFGPHSAAMLTVLLTHDLDRRFFQQEDAQKKEAADDKKDLANLGRECLYRAAKYTDSSAMLMPFFQAYRDFFEAELKNPHSVLLHSAAQGSPHTMRFLLEQGGDLKVAEEKEGNTPLHVLVAGSRDYRSRYAPDAYQTYQVYMALVKELFTSPLHSHLLTSQNARGETPFLYAAENQSYDVISLFGRKDKDNVTAKAHFGNTALHLVMKNFVDQDYNLDRTWPTVKTLLEFEHLNVNTRNRRGQTAFDIGFGVVQEMERNYIWGPQTNAEKKYHLFKIMRALLLKMERDDDLIQQIALLKYYQHELLPTAINSFKPNFNFAVAAESGEYHDDGFGRKRPIPFLHRAIVRNQQSILPAIFKDDRLDTTVIDDGGYSPLLRVCVSSVNDREPNIQRPNRNLEGLPPCTDWQIHLAKQLLSCKNSGINQNQAKNSDRLYLTPLLAAAMRCDQRLFFMLLAHRQLRLVADDFLVLFKLLRSLSTDSMTVFRVSGDGNLKAAQTKASEMVRRLIIRPDFCPIPSVYTIERHASESGGNNTYVDLMLTILLCRDLQLVRLILLHPNMRMPEEKEYRQVAEKLQEEPNEHKREALKIWRARKVLAAAETQFRDRKFSASEKLFAEVRKNDGCLLDTYVYQVIDTSFKDLYQFDDIQRQQLLKMPAVLDTDDVDQLVFLGQRYELGHYVEKDKVLAESFYLKAIQLSKGKSFDAANNVSRCLKLGEEEQQDNAAGVQSETAANAGQSIAMARR